MNSLSFWSAFAPGAAAGATSALGAYSKMPAAAPKGTEAQPTWIDQVLSSASARPPEMAAQGANFEDLISPKEFPVPLRRADVPSPNETKQQGWREKLMTLGDQLRRTYNQRLPNGAVGSVILSARDAKKNIKKDGRSLREIMNTPAVTYRYKDEGKAVPKRPGIIAEQAPKSWRTGPGGNMIKSPAWMGAQHGAIQNLARRVQKLEKGK